MRIILEEFIFIFKDRRLLAALLGLPILVTLFFGYLYVNHKVTEIPTVVLDNDNSSLSRITITAFEQSEKFAVTKYVSSHQELQNCMQRGIAYAAIIIPIDFARDIKTGQSTEVLVIADGSNMILSNSIATGAAEVVGTISAGIELKSLEGLGISGQKAEDIVSAVSFRSRVWYNPTYNYLKFLLPGLIAMGMQQALLISLAIAFFRKTPANKSGGLRNFIIIFCRLIPYVLIGTPVLIFCLILAHSLYNLYIGSNFSSLVIITAAFCLGTAELGLLAALLSPTLDRAIQLAMVIAAPAFLISGFTWPMMAMPLPISFLAQLLPLTHYLEAMRALTMKGARMGDVIPQLTNMLIIAGALIPVCLFVIYLQNKKSSGSVDDAVQHSNTAKGV